MVLTEFDENRYAEILREDGRETGRREGIEEGKLLNLCELVSDGVLPLKEALKRTGLTEKEFKEVVLGFGLKWNKDKFHP